MMSSRNMNSHRLARWASIFFDSSILSILIFPLIGWQAGGWEGVGWAILALFMLTGIPFAYMVIGMRKGWVSDLELTHREERPRFIVVSLSSDLLALAVLWLTGAPRMIWALAAVYASLGVITLTVSHFWKISMHMIGVSGFATLLAFVFGPGAWWAFLALPLVAWARLHRKKHTPAQLLAGALLGAGVTAMVLKLVMEQIP